MWRVWLHLREYMTSSPSFWGVLFRMHRSEWTEIWLRWLVWLLPRKLVMWCAVRVMAHASTGPWGNEHPDSISMMTMLQRWEMNPNQESAVLDEELKVRAIQTRWHPLEDNWYDLLAANRGQAIRVVIAENGKTIKINSEITPSLWLPDKVRMCILIEEAPPTGENVKHVLI